MKRKIYPALVILSAVGIFILRQGEEAGLGPIQMDSINPHSKVLVQSRGVASSNAQTNQQPTDNDPVTQGNEEPKMNSEADTFRALEDSGDHAAFEQIQRDLVQDDSAEMDSPMHDGPSEEESVALSQFFSNPVPGEDSATDLEDPAYEQ